MASFSALVHTLLSANKPIQISNYDEDIARCLQGRTKALPARYYGNWWKHARIMSHKQYVDGTF